MFDHRSFTPKILNAVYTVPKLFPCFLCNWNLFFTTTRLCSANFLMKLWSQIVFSVSLLHQVSPSSRLILCQAPPTIPFLPSLIMQSVGNRCPQVVKCKEPILITLVIKYLIFVELVQFFVVHVSAWFFARDPPK